MSNRDAVQAHTLSTTDSTWTIMGTFIEWKDDNFTNYLAAGYWIHAGTGTSGIEFGAFMDSPENNQDVTVLSSGRATYTGRSASFFVATYGPGLPYPEGTTVASEFQGVFTMFADFDTSMVSGQVILPTPLHSFAYRPLNFRFRNLPEFSTIRPVNPKH